MALVAGIAWGRVQRPWGFEVRVNLTDQATGTIYGEEFVFPSPPTDKDLIAAIEARRETLEARISTEARLAIVDPSPDDVVALKAEVAQLKSAQTAASAAMAATTADKAVAVAAADMLTKDMAALVATNEALVKENEELKKASGGK